MIEHVVHESSFIFSARNIILIGYTPRYERPEAYNAAHLAEVPSIFRRFYRVFSGSDSPGAHNGIDRGPSTKEKRDSFTVA